ncbi:MAG: hypothetical protein AAFR58_16225 [Cyanobacteria bacterium J06627_28]
MAHLIMDAAKVAHIKAHARAIAALLYEETEDANPKQLENFEGIEQAVRSHLLKHVGPEIGEFFVNAQATSERDESAPSKASSVTSASRARKRKR